MSLLLITLLVMVCNSELIKRNQIFVSGMLMVLRCGSVASGKTHLCTVKHWATLLSKNVAVAVACSVLLALLPLPIYTKIKSKTACDDSDVLLSFEFILHI